MYTRKCGVSTAEGVPLVLVEGEKAAKAVQDASFVAVSLYGGAHHADKADYTMFAEQSVVVWPDQDNAGEGFAATASYQLGQAGVHELRFVGLEQQPKGDAADVDPEQRAEILADVLAGPPTTPARTLPRERPSEDEQEVGMFGDLAPGGDAARYLDRYAPVNGREKVRADGRLARGDESSLPVFSTIRMGFGRSTKRQSI